MTDAESRFASRAVRRKRLFLALSIMGVLIAGGLSIYYAARVATDPHFPIGPRAVIVVLILLNARQNLRQYRFVGILEQVLPDDSPQAGEDARRRARLGGPGLRGTMVDREEGQTRDE